MGLVEAVKVTAAGVMGLAEVVRVTAGRVMGLVEAVKVTAEGVMGLAEAVKVAAERVTGLVVVVMVTAGVAAEAATAAVAWAVWATWAAMAVLNESYTSFLPARCRSSSHLCRYGHHLRSCTSSTRWESRGSMTAVFRTCCYHPSRRPGTTLPSHPCCASLKSAPEYSVSARRAGSPGHVKHWSAIR